MGFEACAAAYLAAWNEPDIGAIRGHLDGAVHPDIVFADPANRTVGVAALETLIRTARTETPTARYELTSAIDGGHDLRYRYTWAAHFDDVTVVGMDCTTTTEDGRLLRVDGFFGELSGA